jgi:hypothetical protein
MGKNTYRYPAVLGRESPKENSLEGEVVLEGQMVVIHKSIIEATGPMEKLIPGL